MLKGPIEGFFIESIERLIFDVKGLIHPPDRIIAYVRYVPDPNGERIRDGTRYKKIYSLREREEFLRKNYPVYIYFDNFFNRSFEAVPKSRIKIIYNPCERLKEIMLNSENKLERTALRLIKFLSSSGVDIEALGISGSLLVKMHTRSSDIDVIVYGEKEGMLIYDYLKENMYYNGYIRRYNQDELIKLYKFRSKDTNIPLNLFLNIEKRKILQGTIGKTDFYIRLVKRPKEIDEWYGKNRYYQLKKVEIIARVIDDKDSIFTPCTYKVNDVRILSGNSPYKIREIISFRGRFCEQAIRGEKVFARGTAEVVNNSFIRVIVGEHFNDTLYPLELYFKT